MANNQVILATYDDGREITVDHIHQWMSNSNVYELSKFIYQRLYRRYIKPFEYKNQDYKKDYKDGFSIIANCCLLIETYISFTVPSLKTTHGKSEKCFGYFFVTNPRFLCFSDGGLTAAQYANTKDRAKDSGIPHDFYVNVRCGILHNGETRNGWKISRSGKLFDATEKKINATEFMKEMKKTIKEMHQRLEKSSFDDLGFQTYINRLRDLISKT